jgi:WD40 repeat protein
MNNITLKKELNESIIKLEKIIDDFEFIINHQIFYLDDHISKIKNKIDIHREELVQKIHRISNEMILKLETMNQELINNIKNVDSLSYKNGLSKLKHDLIEKKQLVEADEKAFSRQNIYETIEKIEREATENKKKMKNFKCSLKMNRKIKFEPVDHHLNDIFGQLYVNKYELDESDDNGKLIKSFFHNSNDKLFSIELVENGKYVIGCSNGKIKIFNMNDKECMQILEGHSDYITSIRSFYKTRLISASGDRTIKIWDLKLNECIQTLIGHLDKVNDICLTKNKTYLLSGSSDKTIRVWNLNNYECLTTLVGHTRGVSCVKVNSKNKLVSSANDKTIKIWNLEQFKLEKTILGHKRGIELIELKSNDDIISYSNDNIIKIWDGFTFDCLRSLNFCENKNDSMRLSLLSDEYLIYLINYDKSDNSNINWKINLYDLDKDKTIKIINGPKYCVSDFVIIPDNRLMCLIPETHRYSINIFDLN